MFNSSSKKGNFASHFRDRSYFLTAFQRKLLLENMQAELRPEYHRRIEIMLLADMGYTQTQICEIVGCSQEMARYWMAIAQAGQAHNWQDRPIGRPKTINPQYIERLQELVSHSPREYGYAFRAWTAGWLSKHLAKEFDIVVSDRHINRLLQKLGLSLRQKSSKPDNGNDLSSSKNSGITIGDLQSTSIPAVLWLFKPNEIGSSFYRQ
jgi:transposase